MKIKKYASGGVYTGFTPSIPKTTGNTTTKSSGSSGSSDSKNKKKVSDTIRYPETYKEFCSATGYPGIMTETEYSSHEKTKKKYGTYKKYLKAMYKIYK